MDSKPRRGSVEGKKEDGHRHRKSHRAHDDSRSHHVDKETVI